MLTVARDYQEPVLLLWLRKGKGDPYAEEYGQISRSIFDCEKGINNCPYKLFVCFRDTISQLAENDSRIWAIPPL
jgi:deoxyxylulose-5-phosphate synthase